VTARLDGADRVVDMNAYGFAHWYGGNPRAKEKFDQKKDWIALLNRERDWVKHGGVDEMQIECFDAAMMIARAGSKLEVWTPKMENFRTWFFANLDSF